LSDPGFEQESELDRPGFGWRLGERPEGFRLSLDSNNPNSGQSCLKIEFEGESDPGRPVITQLALVEPGRNYRLRFAARSEALVSGGFPKIAVIEAATNVALGQSEQFPATTDGWREFTVDFATGQSTNAVQITLMRQLCQKSPCPVFGRLWLDSFSLQKI
jgi:hypothetical protein